MMKRMLLCLLMIALLLPAAALGEAGTQRLEMAFGLFWVEIPEDWSPGPVQSNVLADLRCDVSELAWPVYASYAPLETYADTAGRDLDNRVSLLYALSGGGYSETEIAEETLPNGVKLRWQLMRGDAMHTLWFEATTEAYGYNMTLSGEPTEAWDEALLAVMRSFGADDQIEQDLLQLRQTQLDGGAFVSCEHGLKLQLDEGWNIVTDPGLLLPDTAFILEKEEYRWMIQLLYARGWEDGEGRDLLEAYLQMRGYAGNAVPEAITLEQLGGIEAWTLIEESGINMQHIAFIHEGHGYYGSFMWIVPDDAEARPYMDAAIRTMVKPE
ncbi:MAG: hypothetical protein IJE07_11670 [Clostridia bacterium]|nr:hypothetical protein [Clostridia bacterium]